MRCCGAPSCQHALVAGAGIHISGSGAPGDPWVIDRDWGRWLTTVPSPVFTAGLTVGNGEFFDLRYRTRAGSSGELEMDYQGAFRLGSTSTVTAGLQLDIPENRSGIANYFQTDETITFYDRSAQSLIAVWHAAGAAGALALLPLPSGVTGASAPFTWAAGDVIRWDVRDLIVAA